jgi:hypothetical protein
MPAADRCPRYPSLGVEVEKWKKKEENWRNAEMDS